MSLSVVGRAVRRNPLVSVVMSVHNGERFLEVCLSSVLSQQGVDLEFVVVDDGSTDGSPAILASAERSDPRLRVIRQGNTGLTKALARGCSAARGVYIARQDADDVSVAGRLAKLAGVLEARKDVVVASGWVELIGPAEESLRVTRYPEGVEGGTGALLELERNPVHASVMYRKADYVAVGGYRPEFYFAQDADLWLRMVDRGGFLYLPEVLYRVRIADDSISTTHRASQRRLQVLARACRAARAAGASESEHLEQAALVRPGGARVGSTREGAGSYFVGRTLLRNRDVRAAGYLRDYLRKRPLDPRGWLSLLQAHALRMLRK